MNLSLSWRLVRSSLLYIVLNFPTLNLFLGLWFIGYLLRRWRHLDRFGRLLLAFGGISLVFAVRYTVPDRYSFFVPFYLVVAVMIGAAAALTQQRIGRRWWRVAVTTLALVPCGTYAVAPAALQRQGWSLGTRGDVPYRDDRLYFLQPWKTGYHGADRFAHEALTQVETNAVIVADMTTVAPLLIVQMQEGLRPDVSVMNSVVATPFPWEDSQRVEQLLRSRAVYAVSIRRGYCPEGLRRFKAERQGVLWRITAARGNPEDQEEAS